MAGPVLRVLLSRAEAGPEGHPRRRRRLQGEGGEGEPGPVGHEAPGEGRRGEESGVRGEGPGGLGRRTRPSPPTLAAGTGPGARPRRRVGPGAARPGPAPTGVVDPVRGGVLSPRRRVGGVTWGAPPVPPGPVIVGPEVRAPAPAGKGETEVA